MKPTAFTLIELIFVILLVGVLGMTANALFRPDRVLNDTKFVLAKVMKTRYEAIGYDHRNFDGTSVESGPGCLTLEKSALERGDANENLYRMGKTTDIRVTGLDGNTICFDFRGAPHDGDFTLASLLHREVDINVSDGKRSYRIVIYPESGYGAMEETRKR
ncbi:pilus assembly FimT family protein [Hydrogenimonas sp.]